MVYSRRSIGDLQVLIDMIRRYDFMGFISYLNIMYCKCHCTVCSFWQVVN